MKTVLTKPVACCIVDMFEDFLDDKGVEIDNIEKEGDEGEAIIYGDDFDYLMDRITETLIELLTPLGVEINTTDWGNE